MSTNTMKLNKDSSDEEIAKEVKRLSSIQHSRSNARKAAENSAYLGRYFKYRNSYGISDGRKWWGYCVTVRIDKSGFIETLNFETDPDGIPLVRESFVYWGSQMGYTECTKAEAEKAWEKMTAALAAKKPF